jgi:hypothetical protein
MWLLVPDLPLPRGLEFWGIIELVLDPAVDAASRRIHHALRKRRKFAYQTRKPGFDTPCWNVCATLIERELRPYGSKVQLARYLGIPKQRLYDYLNRRSRLPDAELTLRLLHWLAARRRGVNHSI